MFLAQIWRYPVKSMKGEPLRQALLGLDGVEGDRIVQVYNASGRIVTARTRPALLRHQGTLGPDGVPCADGRPGPRADVLRDVEVLVAAGDGAIMAGPAGTTPPILDGGEWTRLFAGPHNARARWGA